MTLMKRDPFFPEFSRFFDDFFTRDLSKTWFDFPSFNNKHIPAVNIKEREGEFEVEVAAPGLQKEDFKVALEDRMLVISAEKKLENEDSEKDYKRKEFYYSSFRRAFELPENVEEDKIKAKYENGLLVLNIPKKEEVEMHPVKTIDIS